MSPRRTAKFRLGAAVAVVGVAAAVAGCGGSSSSASSNTSAPAPAPTSSASGSGAALSIGTSNGSDGTYLTGASGRTLYLWVADANGKSSCSGDCASAWPPLTVKTIPKASAGVNARDLGTVKRAGGAEQVTYKGHPLYYFAGDTGAGQVTGQGSDQFGAKWWLVAPSGSAITGSGY